MKKNKSLLFALALISATTTFAANKTDDKQEVPLKEVHDIKDGYTPHRAPYRNLCPAMLLFNEAAETIEFTSDTDIYNVFVNIYDGQENIICTYTIDIYADETTSVSISELIEGDYRIEVVIDGIRFEGTLVVF
jgi:hypothetical protein